MAYSKEGNSVHLIQLVTKLKTMVYSLFEEKDILYLPAILIFGQLIQGQLELQRSQLHTLLLL